MLYCTPSLWDDTSSITQTQLSSFQQTQCGWFYVPDHVSQFMVSYSCMVSYSDKNIWKDSQLQKFCSILGVKLFGNLDTRAALLASLLPRCFQRSLFHRIIEESTWWHMTTEKMVHWEGCLKQSYYFSAALFSSLTVHVFLATHRTGRQWKSLGEATFMLVSNLAGLSSLKLFSWALW